MRSQGTFTMATALVVLDLLLSGAALAAEEAPVPPQPPPAAPQQPPAGIRLNFKDASLDAVLQHLSEVAGLAVVTDEPVDGRITLVSRQPLSVEEAISLLDSALKEKGYAAIRTGRVLKILQLADAKQENIPVRSGSDAAQIVPSDRLITQVIPLRSVDAVKVAQDLASLVPEYADLSSNASSNALILTDTEANVRRVVEIVSALDSHKATVVEVRVFPLRYADATNAARLINEIFEVEDTRSRDRSRSRFPFDRMFRGRGDERSTEAGAHQPAKTVASADERTNTVVVSGPTETLKVVEQVVRELDANPLEEQAVLIYRLKNAQAKNLEEVLNKLFEETDTETAARRTTGGGRQQQPSRGPLPPFMGQPLSQAAVESTTELAGQVDVVADEDTNSLIIMTAPKHFTKIREILDELDTPVPQVLIKVLIAEVTHGDDVDLGVEFSGMDIRPSGRRIEGGTDFGVAAPREGPKGLTFTVIEKNVTAAVAVLEETGKLDILSRPYILASDNREATITIGKEVPFIRDSRITETGQTLNTIQYEDIGIILKVTPHINPDGLVIMDVAPEISSTTGEKVAITGQANAEVFAKRSAESRVAIRDGQTIVIGGLMEDRKTENIKKVPILGDIPLLGLLFRRTVREKSKTELLIFLTPHVASEPEELNGISDAERKHNTITPNAVEPGAFDKHMDAMRGNGQTTPRPQQETSP